MATLQIIVAVGGASCSQKTALLARLLWVSRIEITLMEAIGFLKLPHELHASKRRGLLPDLSLDSLHLGENFANLLIDLGFCLIQTFFFVV